MFLFPSKCLHWIFILIICDLDLPISHNILQMFCFFSDLTNKNHFPDFTLTFFWLCHCQWIKRVGQIYLDLIFLLSLLWIVTSLSPVSPLSSLASPAVPSLLIPRHIWWENPDSGLSLGAVMMIYRDIISLSHQQENQVTTLNLLFYICFLSNVNA